jgi:uncharacterized protein YPO0396
MKTETITKTVEYTCDFCGNKFETRPYSLGVYGLAHAVITKIEIDFYQFGPTYKYEDICEECQEALRETLQKRIDKRNREKCQNKLVKL